MVDKKLDGKAGRDFTSKRLDHTENMIDKLLVTIDELWLLLRKKDSCHKANDNDKEHGGNEQTNNAESRVSTGDTENCSFNQDIPKDKLVFQANSTKVLALQRNGSFVKSSSRPCTSPGNLSYYLT